MQGMSKDLVQYSETSICKYIFINRFIVLFMILWVSGYWTCQLLKALCHQVLIF